MAFSGHDGHANSHAIQKLLILFVIGLTIMGNAAEFCSMISPALECSTRVYSVIGLAVGGAVLAAIGLLLRLVGMASPKTETPIALLLLVAWVASSAILSSYKTEAVKGGDGAAFHGSPGFFASWVATVLAASLFVDAALTMLGIGTTTTGTATAGAVAVPVKATTNDEYADDSAAATYA